MKSSGSGSGSGGNARRAAAAAPLSNYEFDFGNLGRGSGNTTLSGLKQPAPSQPQPQQPQQQQAKQAQPQPWTHKPVSSLTGTSSMVGDITGRSWVPLESSATAKSRPASNGVVGGVGNSKADLFSDLLKTPMTAMKSGSGSTAAPMAASLNRGAPMKDGGRSANAGGFVGMSAPPPPPSAGGGFVGMSAPPPQAAAMDKLFEPASSGRAQDPLDDLWRKIPPPQPQAPPQAQASVSMSNGIHGLNEADWDTGFQAADADPAPATTELDGLPPPPAGVTGSLAKDKGDEFQKQGQFADAIKWLTWAVVLLDKSPDKLTGVLATRAACYKEVGEYKKAVGDCSKVLEMAGPTAEVLLQRAFLYESMEKYKLCVQDLREALQRDPSNRMARNTLARLARMADE
ncbi:hypothetical protein SELMODRAFT_447095 [Selaginella moellendorffii]|uniref:Uncharacterized protein n=1 Tax=Selaginella moellendorffii TaxID=88036 RepID=D8SWN4_SELML|nr:uncharacterized protein LOC9651890 [Selaginella moellendorffii]EFJ11053.1 hypothetical protein SELMODRAFT_447095 [Selaginella moellendorffii]|eukprot:XP_002987750.1 uncharacterized protein LOC9651890 [Selaginella moellendorffii]